MRRCTIALGWFLTLATALSAAAQAGAADTVAILLPGAGGAVPSDFLMRNLNSFKRAGMRTVVTTSPDKAATISKSEHARGHHIVIVGMSRGTIHVAQALATGAQVSRALFVSGNFKAMMGILHTPARLPETLVVH
jgi:hypothetical protein